MLRFQAGRLLLSMLRNGSVLVAIGRKSWWKRPSAMLLHIYLLHLRRHSYGMAMLLEMLLGLVLRWHLLG
jgi:hypothetical protein